MDIRKINLLVAIGFIIVITKGVLYEKIKEGFAN
jgi:hypothetical protein